MPIVDIEIVVKPDETFANEMVSELADRLGMIFGSAKNGTWVKVHQIAAHHYAENQGKAQEVYPIFVSLLKSRWPALDEMQKEVDAITGIVAEICHRPPGFVHVIYQPEGKGRIAFGGRVVT